MAIMDLIIKWAIAAYVSLGFDSVAQVRNLKTNTFDYIVVGGGTGGSIVASELASKTSSSVMLLDSGGSPSYYSDIPYAYFHVYKKESKDILHCFGTEKPTNKVCWGSNCEICESRILGGGSSTNGFTYVRGTRYDFDSWSKLGNEFGHWSYDSVLPLMKDLEQFDRPAKNRGTNGPVRVTEGYGDYWNLQETWLKAGKQLGYKILDDVNRGDDPIGFGKVQNNIRDGVRETMVNAFVKKAQAKDRSKKFHVSLFSHVVRVLFDNKNKAIGVEYMRGKRGGGCDVLKAYARKEVIMAAGAIQTPYILIHSGVGPKDQIHWLKHNVARYPFNKDVRLVKELEGVGKNLQDHPFMHMIKFRLDWNKQQPMLKFSPTPTDDDWIQYKRDHSGALSNGSSSGLAFLRTHNQLPGDIPVEIALSGNMHAKVILNGAYSTGEVRLNYDVGDRYSKKDPFVRLNLLTDPRDEQNLLEGAKALRDVFKTKAFRDLGAAPYHYDDPRLDECKPLFTSDVPDEYLKCLVRVATVTGYHYTSTCKMGPRSDPKAVVDDHLRVYGVRNLRIADASVMPNNVRANPSAAVMLIGYKAAQMIIADNK